MESRSDRNRRCALRKVRRTAGSQDLSVLIPCNIYQTYCFTHVCRAPRDLQAPTFAEHSYFRASSRPPDRSGARCRDINIFSKKYSEGNSPAGLAEYFYSAPLPPLLLSQCSFLLRREPLLFPPSIIHNARICNGALPVLLFVHYYTTRLLSQSHRLSNSVEEHDADRRLLPSQLFPLSYSHRQ